MTWTMEYTFPQSLSMNLAIKDFIQNV